MRVVEGVPYEAFQGLLAEEPQVTASACGRQTVLAPRFFQKRRHKHAGDGLHAGGNEDHVVHVQLVGENRGSIGVNNAEHGKKANLGHRSLFGSF